MVNNIITDFINWNEDLNHKCNQLLDCIKNECNLRAIAKTEIDFDRCDLFQLRVLCTLIEYKVSLYNKVNENKIDLDKSYFDDRLYGKAIFMSHENRPFERVKTFLNAPYIFRKRNVYFDISGLGRI